MAAGASLVSAPILLLAGALLHRVTHEDGTDHLAVVRDNPDRYFTAHAILLAGLVLFLVAVLALLHMVRERDALLGHLGAGLAFVGIVGSAAIVGTDGIAISQMAQAGASEEEMAALLDRIKDFRGLRIIGGVSGVCFLVGMLALTFGVWRSAASRWLAAGIAVAAVTFFIAQVTDDQRIFRLAFAFYGIAFVPLGVRTLAQSDDEWAAPHATPRETTHIADA